MSDTIEELPKQNSEATDNRLGNVSRISNDAVPQSGIFGITPASVWLYVCTAKKIFNCVCESFLKKVFNLKNKSKIFITWMLDKEEVIKLQIKREKINM